MKPIKPIFLFQLAICFIAVQSCSDEPEIDNIDQFEEYINEEIENQNIPAMSLVLFNGDDVLYESYLGKSDIEADLNLEKDHPFLLASVSKVVTGTALLQLYDQGLFNLDDPINDYLSFEVNNPNYSTSISFRMLLTHTSGIADGSALDDEYYYEEDSPIALDFFLSNYLEQGGQFYNKDENYHDIEPGVQYQYSNIGSALVGLLVEQLSNQDFNEYCKKNIFQPLGMKHTFWRLEEAFQSGVPLVKPYNWVNDQYEVVKHYTFTDYPNGGLRSTARDLTLFFGALVQGGNSNGVTLLQKSTIGLMLSSQIPNINNETGLHIFKMDSANDLWGHDGGEEGASTTVAFNPDTKTGAIILTNQGAVDLDKISVEAYKIAIQL